MLSTPYNQRDYMNSYPLDNEPSSISLFPDISLPQQNQMYHVSSFDSSYQGSLDYNESNDGNSIDTNSNLIIPDPLPQSTDNLALPESYPYNGYEPTPVNTYVPEYNGELMNSNVYYNNSQSAPYTLNQQQSYQSPVPEVQSSQQTVPPTGSFDENSTPTSSDSENQKTKRRQKRKTMAKMTVEEKKKKKEIRLARNRESAHRSRARHKEYVANLEHSVEFLRNKVNLLENTLMKYIGKEHFLQLFNPEYYDNYNMSGTEVKPVMNDDSETSSSNSSPIHSSRMFSVSMVFLASFLFSCVFQPLQKFFPFLSFMQTSANTPNEYLTTGLQQSQQAFMFQSFTSLLSPQFLSDLILSLGSDFLIGVAYSLIFALFIVFIYLFVVPHIWLKKPRWRTTPHKLQYSIKKHKVDHHEEEEEDTDVSSMDESSVESNKEKLD